MHCRVNSRRAKYLLTRKYPTRKVAWKKESGQNTAITIAFGPFDKTDQLMEKLPLTWMIWIESGYQFSCIWKYKHWMKICDASNPLVQICLSVHSISLLGEPELHQNHQSVKVNVNPPPLHTIRIMKLIWQYLKTFVVQENFPLDKFRTSLKINLTVSSLQYVAFYALLCCTATVLHHIYAIIGSTLISRGNNTPLQKRKGGCLHFRVIFIYTITIQIQKCRKEIEISFSPQKTLSFVPLPFIVSTFHRAVCLCSAKVPFSHQNIPVFPDISHFFSESKYIVFNNSFTLSNPVAKFINYESIV